MYYIIFIHVNMFERRAYAVYVASIIQYLLTYNGSSSQEAAAKQWPSTWQNNLGARTHRSPYSVKRRRFWATA